MTTRRFALGCAVAAAALFGGCLGEPEVEQRWTNLELLRVDTGASGLFAIGDSVRVDLRSRVTFRRHFVGTMVAELRVSQSLSADSLFLDAEGDAIEASEEVQRLLDRSSPVARHVKGMAGFPSLRRTLDLDFEAVVPDFVNGAFDPPGGTPRSLFLVLYMGDGEEIELEDGRDSLVVTPFDTHEDEVLFKALALPLEGGDLAP